MKARYAAYPETTAGFDGWRRERDDTLERVYDRTGAEPRYPP